MRRLAAFLLGVTGAGLVRLGVLAHRDPLYRVARAVGRSLDRPIEGMPPVVQLVVAGLLCILLALLLGSAGSRPPRGRRRRR